MLYFFTELRLTDIAFKFIVAIYLPTEEFELILCKLI